jgi:hypothetical protein
VAGMRFVKLQNDVILYVRKVDALENICVRDNIFELKSRKRLVNPSLHQENGVLCNLCAVGLQVVIQSYG